MTPDDSVRAKFRVQQVDDQTSSEGQRYGQRIKMFPVYSADPDSENRAFWNATPSGACEMYINNSAAFDFFKEGGEYYLDFTPA